MWESDFKKHFLFLKFYINFPMKKVHTKHLKMLWWQCSTRVAWQHCNKNLSNISFYKGTTLNYLGKFSMGIPNCSGLDFSTLMLFLSCMYKIYVWLLFLGNYIFVRMMKSQLVSKFLLKLSGYLLEHQYRTLDKQRNKQEMAWRCRHRNLFITTNS